MVEVVTVAVPRKSILFILIATYEKKTLSFGVLDAYLNIPKTNVPEENAKKK